MHAQHARAEARSVRSDGRRTNGDARHDLHDKPIPELFRDLSHDTSLLVRQETQLFKAEMHARVTKLERTAGVLGLGGAIAWFGAMALTAALILGLAEVMDGWVAALIVGVAYVLAGGIALAMGKKRLSEQELMPTETQKSVKKDIRMVREAARLVTTTSRTTTRFGRCVATSKRRGSASRGRSAS